jgi:carbon storage regulator
MLRISRRVGERVRIGDDIIIEVLEVSGASVRIGVEAPRAIPIYREEVWLAIKAENEAAGEVPIDLDPPQSGT